MTTSIIVLVIGLILCLAGILGSIIPGIPGPQLNYFSLILIQLFGDNPFSRRFILIRGILIILLTIADYYLPILGTKKFGGTKRGNRGCIIGTLIGLFGGPLGVILGPFIGSLIGEYIYNKDTRKSIKAAFGSFIGFLSGVILKIIISIILTIYFISGGYNQISNQFNSNTISINDNAPSS